jgi:hypothetical protein
VDLARACRRNVRLGAVLCVTLAVASCASSVELPVATRDVTVCLFQTLKSAPEVRHIRVYSAAPNGPIISYHVHTKDGIRDSTDLGISGPDANGDFRYSGAIGAGNNPIDGLKEQIEASCHAYPRFTDQVFLTDGLRTIDMSAYAH